MQDGDSSWTSLTVLHHPSSPSLDSRGASRDEASWTGWSMATLNRPLELRVSPPDASREWDIYKKHRRAILVGTLLTRFDLSSHLVQAVLPSSNLLLNTLNVYIENPLRYVCLKHIHRSCCFRRHHLCETVH